MIAIISAYQKKLSGPLLDRIDMTVCIQKVPNETLIAENTHRNIQHLAAQEMIRNATAMQRNRYGSSSKYNANLSSKDVRKFCTLSTDCLAILKLATDRLNLSARSYFKIIKVAQTIADLTGESSITPQHLSEALQYRQTS